MTKIKICGITNNIDAARAVELGADALGFVFAESVRRIEVDSARVIVESIPPFVTAVAVFVNPERSFARAVLNKTKIAVVQFHGEEAPRFCAEFRRDYKVIKAHRIKDRNSVVRMRDYEVDVHLLDSFVADKRGGTGMKFDWNLAKAAREWAGPIILSGGLTPSNVAEAIRIVEPYAVDVSSGVEKIPGKKSVKLMEEFIHAARSARTF